MAESNGQWLRIAAIAELERTDRIVVHAAGRVVLVVRAVSGQIYAIDNRCPHMGFPLSRGSVHDCILTCHWHHARFDLATGGTFDQFADDVRAFPMEVRGDEIWINTVECKSAREQQQERLRVGLERNIPLVLAKAALVLSQSSHAVQESSPFQAGLEFGTHYRDAGWGVGLTIHTCLANLSPYLDDEDRPLALYHGLSAIARECEGTPPRFGIRPLPASSGGFDNFKRWFRQFIEVRDEEGAERCLVSAWRMGMDRSQIADMLFSAATDHRYIDGGHSLDFTNKALEALDLTDWQQAEPVLASLVSGYARAARMEESNAWRHPIDLVEMLEHAFQQLPNALALPRGKEPAKPETPELLATLLGDSPQVIIDHLLTAIRSGWTLDRLAAAVTRAAALRVARFPTSNEFGDWDTAHHTFTFANAVQQGLRRTASPELARGVFDAAMSVYLDRFLNVPAVPLPEPTDVKSAPEELLTSLADALDRQQRVGEAAEIVKNYLAGDGDPARLLAVMGKLLLREDRNFHTIQMVEAAFRQFTLRRGTSAAAEVLIAAARYLAAHAPTARAQVQTYEIARRLHRGEHLFGGED